MPAEVLAYLMEAAAGFALVVGGGGVEVEEGLVERIRRICLDGGHRRARPLERQAVEAVGNMFAVAFRCEKEKRG